MEKLHNNQLNNRCQRKHQNESPLQTRTDASERTSLDKRAFTDLQNAISRGGSLTKVVGNFIQRQGLLTGIANMSTRNDLIDSVVADLARKNISTAEELNPDNIIQALDEMKKNLNK